jgi:glyoxylase-like metal-dependent hydrolase (beta-lactamase superfamily II)
MIRVDTLTVGMFASNSYVVSCEKTKEAIIIDAGDEGDRIVGHVKESGLDARLLVLTHGHIDHVSAVPAVVQALGVPIAMHKDELPLYERVDHQAMLFGLRNPGTVPVDRFLADGDEVAFGDLTARVIHMPGHSPGGIALAFDSTDPPRVFVGDVLFQGSIGRTDLMGASHPQMMKTLKNVVLELPDDMVVYSGHGPDTTIGAERRSNPFLLEARGWGD